MKKVFLFFFIISGISILKLSGQNPGYYTFTQSNGLPSNTIYDIIQDSDGFIWFATDYGVSKFDGKSFTNFEIEDGLPDNEILYFFKDSTERIWLIGYNGKIGFYKDHTFYNVSNSKILSKLQFSDYALDVFEDSKNNIWFLENATNIKKLTPDGEILNYTYNQKFVGRYSKKLSIGESDNGSIYLILSKFGDNNIRTNNELVFFDIEKQISITPSFKNLSNKTISKLRVQKTEGLYSYDSISKNISFQIFDVFNYNQINNLIYKVKFKDDYAIVTNLNNGLLFLDLKNPSNSQKLFSQSITTRSYVDDEDNIWIGTQSDGVHFFPNVFTTGFQFSDSEKNDFRSVGYFNNSIFIGNNQSQIFVFNQSNFNVLEENIYSTHSTRVSQFVETNNKLYVVSEEDLLFFDSSLFLRKIKFLNSNDSWNQKLTSIKSISLKDSIIYTSHANGVGKLNIKNNQLTKIWDKRSTSIYASESDTTWVGTTSGLYYYTNDTIQKYNLTTEFDNSIIYDLKENACGLLIGTNSHGLGILNNGKLDIISKKDGLLSDYIKSIFVESKNKIWLSTNFGLNYIELDASNKLKDIKSFTISDGLYSNDVRGCVVKNNKVYVATSNGLNIMDLRKDKNLHKPKIKINSVQVNNNPINISSEKIFNHTLNTFQFEYSGISFKSLGNIGFKYMLEGLEKDWVETENTNVRFSSLPPNKYTFKIKSINKDGTESDEVEEFSFIIKPPFYKTWWFITSFIIFSILLLLFILYRREQKIKIKRQTKEKISSLRYQALNAQMNPHFLNNLLNTIEALSSKNKFQLVKEILTKFTSLINLVLNATKSNVISLKEEMEMVELYLDLQQIRFEKSINKNITYALGDIDIEDILVPPMIIQPIIENSFKHGFTNTQKLYSLTIDFKIEENSYVICEIIDNGTSSEKTANTSSSGISFKNINERLQLFNENRKKENLIFYSEIKNEFDKLEGFKVKIKIPLVNL